ncbi:MAG TPA: hypothetical protein DCP02_00785 [Actinobacteria bacterium]|nr:hypothetical protein [Actinomycetota bacterium]
MKIGIISDTHDDIDNIKKAVKIFKDKGIKTVIHLGDIVAPPAIKFFKGFKLIGIFGNNDGYKQFLLKTYKSIGGDLKGDFASIEIDGLKFALYHGEFQDITEALAKSGDYDFVLSGHTHSSMVTKSGKTILANPGSAHRYFTNDSGPTLAVLDTGSKKVEIIMIDK